MDKASEKVRKSHPNSTRLNHFIAKKLIEANDKLLEMESGQKQVTAQVVTRNIIEKVNVSSFFELAETYFEKLKAQGQLSRLSSEKPRINHFKRFLKHKDITFSEITETLLNQFQGYLKTERGNSERSIVNSLVVIRTLAGTFHLSIICN